MTEPLVLIYMPARAHGGTLRQQRLWVCHSTEGPMSRGNARALAGPNWFGGPAGTSAHAIFDPREGVEMVKPNIVAYHVGPGGNGISLGSEHCGKVTLTKAQWLSADGTEMLRCSARWTAQYCHRFNIEPRWGKLPELAAGGHLMCTHNDIRLVFGGTTHSDPGPNFPYGQYQEWVQDFYHGREDDVPNTPQELEDAAYKAIERYEQGRHAAGQPTPQEAYQASDDLLRQAQANGAGITELARAINRLQTTVETLIKQ
jgi:hypothetical protein